MQIGALLKNQYPQTGGNLVTFSLVKCIKNDAIKNQQTL